MRYNARTCNKGDPTMHLEQYKTTFWQKALQAIGATLAMTVLALLFMFAFFNFMLGCETWDETYWTERNSCITPAQFLMLD
jgi:hypothetical protein